MPQLPSGRQIVIDPNSLNVLLEDTSNPASIQKILAIDSIQKIKEWIEVAYFLTPEEAKFLGKERLLDTRSLTPPPGLVVVGTGTPISDWETLAADWGDEDRQAMAAFLLEPRCMEFLEGRLNYVRTLQKQYLNSDNLLTRLSTAWWQAGVHPAQEEGYEEIWGDEDSPVWDTYDMLAALGNIVAYVATHPETYEQHGNAFDRATGTWRFLLNHHPFLHKQFPSDTPPRAVAKAWREENPIGLIPADKQKWLHEQMVIECVNLWSHAGETLKECCAKAYAIITLVSISPEGNQRELGK